MRRLCLTLLCTSALSACLASPAGASVGHTVGPGETLWSIAAANGFTTHALAAANGLSVDSQVRLGATIQIPSISEAQVALGVGTTEAEGETNPATTQLSSSPPAAAPTPMGGYTVQPGDSLSAIAARVGASMGQIAFMNGLSTNGVLLAGTVIKLPTSSPAPAQTTAPVSSRVVPHAAPYASGGHVGADQIAQIAASHGVSPSLADAIAWQESGFNNASVSNANARGVMQIMPGTWSWIQGTLANRPLNPASPTDNVHAGVLYLGSLLRSTGSPALAAAAYYQGLGSVRRVGMLPETRRYVNNVMALRSRFGGG
jgi:LysM repeat protein